MARRERPVVSEGVSHPLGMPLSASVPDGDVAESTVKPLIGMAGEGPAPADLGMFSVLSAEERAPGEAEPYRLRPVEPAPGRASGGHRRKGRRPVAAAAAVAGTAVAVGAIALAIHFLSGQDRATEVLPDNNTSAPELITPSEDASAATTGAAPATSRSAGPSVSSGASPAAATVAAVSSAPAVSRSATASAPASASGSGSDGKGNSRVLRTGDSGSQVVELQDRLKQLGLYDSVADGVYDADVQSAVSLYQARYRVHGDADGTYGPHTRRSLESRTTAT
jgi:hypothetical protein